MFLKLGDIKGESIDAKHKDEIDVINYYWEMSQSGSMHSGSGGGSGKVSVGDIVITKFLDRSTPNLQLFCCNGKHIKEAVLTLRKAGENPLEYYKITMKDVLISYVSTAGSMGDRLIETVTLNFAEYSSEYIPQQKDGTGGASVLVGWNIAKNMTA